MSSSVLVRRAEAGDLPGVLLLERSTAEAPHWPEAAYRDYISGSASTFQAKALFVAIFGHDLKAFAAAIVVGDEAELESIVVAEAARRSGLGSRLLAAVEVWAQGQGACSVLLEVRGVNAEAQAFYRSRGFTHAGLRRGYYKDPIDDATLLRKELSERAGSAQ